MISIRPISVATLIMVSQVWAADAPPRAGNPTGSTLESPLAGQPLDRLSATRERPLFSPTRRPPPPLDLAVSGPEPPPLPLPPPTVALLGVVMDGGEARAIVRTSAAADVVRVRVGDDIGGWKVAQIEVTRLVLSVDDRVATFAMFAGSDAGAASPADLVLQSADKPSPGQRSPNQMRQNEPSDPAMPRRPHRTRQ
jgi:hypothetical protein